MPPSTAINFAKFDLSAGDGGFAVTSTTPEPPGPWGYDDGTGTWTVDLMPAPAAYRPTKPPIPADDRDGVATVDLLCAVHRGWEQHGDGDV